MTPKLVRGLTVCLGLVLLWGCAPSKPEPNLMPSPYSVDAANAGEPASLQGRDLDQPPSWARTEDGLPEEASSATGATILSQHEYLIGPADELDITVFQVEDLSGTRVVSARGDIRMPLLGGVKVAGLSAQQVEDLLVTLYGEQYLQNPQISVAISHYASQQVTILGQVRDPGVYPLKGRTTLLQAMAMGGGPTRVANEEEVVVFRTEPDGAVYGYLVNIDEIVAGIKRDPEVIGSDRIVVPESGFSAFMRGISIGIPGFGGYRQY